jgi:uncharacterized protein YggE
MQKELREDLMNEAIADASSKAGELADGLGVEITGVQTASVNEGGASPVYYAADREAVPMEDGAASTPIEPGESTVSMSVQVTYYIG